jgi:hypothetical protein
MTLAGVCGEKSDACAARQRPKKSNALSKIQGTERQKAAGYIMS